MLTFIGDIRFLLIGMTRKMIRTYRREGTIMSKGREKRSFLLEYGNINYALQCNMIHDNVLIMAEFWCLGGKVGN